MAFAQFRHSDFERRRFYDASAAFESCYQICISYCIDRTSLRRGVYHNAHWHADSGIRRPDSNGQLQSASLLTFLFVLLRIMPIVRLVNGARAQLSSFQGPLSNIKELLRTDNKTYLQDGTSSFPDCSELLSLWM